MRSRVSRLTRRVRAGARSRRPFQARVGPAGAESLRGLAGARVQRAVGLRPEVAQALQECGGRRGHALTSASIPRSTSTEASRTSTTSRLTSSEPDRSRSRTSSR